MAIKFTETKRTEKNAETKSVANAKGKSGRVVKGVRKVAKAKTHVKKA
jgi:hypothetical protein